MNEPQDSGDVPDWTEVPSDNKSRSYRVEQTETGFWCFRTGSRSAGDLNKIPLNETIKWILEQICFGHITTIRDKSGDIVSLRIGRESPSGIVPR